MSHANALIAFNSNQLQNFLDNFRFDTTTDGDGRSIHTRKRTDFAPFVVDDTLPVEEQVTLDPYNRLHLEVNLDSDGMWKEWNVAPPVITVLENMMVDATLDADGKIAMIEYLRTFFDGRFQVLGVWYQGNIPENVTEDGEAVQHGETITRATYDDEGTELTPETISGINTRTYPLFPQYLEWMPDDVTYDADGNETSRTDAVAFKQVNMKAGQKARLF